MTKQPAPHCGLQSDQYLDSLHFWRHDKDTGRPFVLLSTCRASASWAIRCLKTDPRFHQTQPPHILSTRVAENVILVGLNQRKEKTVFERDKRNDTIAARIRQARTMKGWSRAELAARVELPIPKIAKCEAGTIFISDDIVFLFARAFNLRRAFFVSDDNVKMSNVRFRTQTNMTERERDKLIETIKIRFETIKSTIESIEHCPIPSFRPPRAKIESPKDAFTFAVSLSQEWKITPDSNFIDILENKGILFIEITGVSANFNGMAAIINEFPVIAVNSRRPEQQREAISYALAFLLGIEGEELCNAFVRGIPKRDEYADEIEKSSFLEKLIWKTWLSEIIYHNDTEHYLCVSESAFKEMMEARLEGLKDE